MKRSEQMKEINRTLSWREYFVGVANLSAKRSKDPHTQVGAVIVDKDNRIISTGYNGLPRTMNDTSFDWKDREWKHKFVIHAEMNAILNAHGKDLRGATLYCTMIPCQNCAKLIAQSGITKVYYTNFREEFHETILLMECMGLDFQRIYCEED